MPKHRKQHLPMEQILKMTQELSPDDLEAGEVFDGQALIEKRDAYSPDDNIYPNPIAVHPGEPHDEQ